MRDILRLSLPLTFWLAAFSAVYGLQGLVCSSRWTPLLEGWPGRTLLLVAVLAALAGSAGLLMALRSRRWGSGSAFVRNTSIALALAALVATAWTLMPVLVASRCL